MSEAIEVGKTYDVKHSRKSDFRMKVDGVNGEWISGTMVSGTTKTMNPLNSASKGEEVTVRQSLAKFTLVNAPID